DRSNLPTGRRAGPSPRTPEDPARDRVESRYGQRDDYWGFSTGRRSGGYFGGSGAYRAPLAPWIGGGSSYGAPYGYDPRHGGYGLDAYDSRYGGYGYDRYDRRYGGYRSEEDTSETQAREKPLCRLLPEKK